MRTWWCFGAIVVGVAAASCGGRSELFGLAGPDDTEAPDAAVDPTAPDASSDTGPGLTQTERDSGLDATEDASDSGFDAPAPACDLGKPFGSPSALGSLTSAGNEFDLRFLPGELTAYFESDRNGSPQLFGATRADASTSFDPPFLLPGVNVPGAEAYAPSPTTDGLTLYLASNALDDSGLFKVGVSTRANVAVSFGTPSLLANVNSTASDGCPAVTPDGATLYFESTRNGGIYGLYVAFLEGSSFGAAAPIAELDTQEATHPAIRADELQLFFGSPRAGTVRGEDVWVTARASSGQPWGTPVNVGEINTIADDDPTWISDDGCRLYLQSDRSSDGLSHLYVATRP